MSEDEFWVRLKYEPTPENAPKLAEELMAFIRETARAKLDYSPESLEKVDEIIESMRRDAVKIQEAATMLFLFGCYVGEVVVRNNNARWRNTEETPMSGFASWPLVVEFDTGTICNPINKVFKRFENGEEDSVVYFYKVFTSPRVDSE